MPPGWSSSDRRNPLSGFDWVAVVSLEVIHQKQRGEQAYFHRTNRLLSLAAREYTTVGTSECSDCRLDGTSAQFLPANKIVNCCNQAITLIEKWMPSKPEIVRSQSRPGLGGSFTRLALENALVLTGLATWPSVPSERPDTCQRPDLVKLAGATGLEPATSCVTARRSEVTD